MAAILLDTTVLIDILRGRQSTIDRLKALRNAADQPYVTAINVEETVRGLRPSDQHAARRLFEGLRNAPLGNHEGWQAGEWRREFAADGVTLAQADCLIAAAALSLDARLATGNPKDFPMEDVQVDHWPTG